MATSLIQTRFDVGKELAELWRVVKREKCKVNDVIFPSGCEARAINLGNKNMKIGIFTGGTSVRLKNIFTDISRYPIGKHEIIYCNHLAPKSVGQDKTTRKHAVWS